MEQQLPLLADAEVEVVNRRVLIARAVEAADEASPTASRPDWYLDDRTKVVGRQGIAAARRALAQHRRAA